MTQHPTGTYDVIVIGAGVVGCATARHLALRSLAVALVEADDDVGNGTSKANTAILHTGFDARPGTLESRLVARGHGLLRDFAAAAGIPTEPLGALLIAWDDQQLAALPRLAAKAARNGYRDTRRVNATDLYAREPNLGPGACGALEIPGEAIVCPWTTTLALATHALAAGARLFLKSRVTRVQVPPDGPLTVHTGWGRLQGHYVINAAGLHSDDIDRMFGHADFTITPRKGQLIVFDKLARRLVNHVLLPVPTASGKGVLVAPTVYGNVLLGPTAEDVADKADTSCSGAGLGFLRERGRHLVPALVDEEVTATYAGLRAASEHADYQIHDHPEQRYVCAAGIRSTGLTSSMAIGEYVYDLLVEAGLPARDEQPVPPPRMANIGETTQRPYQREDLIASDPEYGRLICHCERVSRGEVRDALSGPVPATSLNALRRRTRVLMGRCQGFYCGAAVDDMLRTGRKGLVDERGG
jgi:glycerol-3-phosphate dehydrogenase